MTVTVSSRFQMTIPTEVRKMLNLLPGQKLHVIPFKDCIELIPAKSIKSMRGFLKGIIPAIERDWLERV